MNIIVTQELLKQLKNAQLKHLRQMLHDYMSPNGTDFYYSDDGYDYLRAAMALASDLMTMEMDGDTEALAKLLNVSADDEDGLFQSYACDGICPEIYDLNPNSADFDSVDWNSKWKAEDTALEEGTRYERAFGDGSDVG